MINTTLFTQIGLDSGALTQLGSVVHQVPEPGEYRGVVLSTTSRSPTSPSWWRRKADLSSTSTSRHSPGRSRTTAAAVASRRGAAARRPPVAPRRLRRAAYAVVVSAVTANGRGQVVSTPASSARATFRRHRARPGRYRVANTVTGAEASSTWPTRSSAGGRCSRASRVRATVGDRFEPDDISVRASQGQAYAVESGARIVVKLVEPYDRKPRGDGPRHRWVRKPAGTLGQSGQSVVEPGHVGNPAPVSRRCRGPPWRTAPRRPGRRSWRRPGRGTR